MRTIPHKALNLLFRRERDEALVPYDRSFQATVAFVMSRLRRRRPPRMDATVAEFVQEIPDLFDMYGVDDEIYEQEMEDFDDWKCPKSYDEYDEGEPAWVYEAMLENHQNLKEA